MASIKEISERKFKITVSNGYRPDGKKICKAKTIDVPKTVQKRSIRQYVDHAAEELEREFKTGYSEDGEMTFQVYAERWLARQVKYAQGTLAMYRRSLNVVYPIIGHIKLNRLRPIALEQLLMELRKRRYRGKQIQEATVQKYLTVVSAVLRDAKKNEIIPKNPARMIDLPGVQKRTQMIPTVQEANQLIHALVEEPRHYAVFYLLAIYTGCRRGELCALKWSDIRITGSTGILTICRSRSAVQGRGILEGPPKSGHPRTISLDTNILLFLAGYLIHKQWEAESNGFRFSEYLFTDAHGQLPHPDTFSKRLRKLYRKLGLPDAFHLHTLRHYYVSTLLHNGIDRQTVASLAGHCDTSYLEQTYCHPQMELKQKAAVQMSQIIQPLACFGIPEPEPKKLLVSTNLRAAEK